MSNSICRTSLAEINDAIRSDLDELRKLRNFSQELHKKIKQLESINNSIGDLKKQIKQDRAQYFKIKQFRENHSKIQSGYIYIISKEFDLHKLEFHLGKKSEILSKLEPNSGTVYIFKTINPELILEKLKSEISEFKVPDNFYKIRLDDLMRYLEKIIKSGNQIQLI